MLQPQVGHQQQEQLLQQQLLQPQFTLHNFLHGISLTPNSIQFSENNFLLPSLQALLLQSQQQPQMLQQQQQLSSLRPQDYQSQGIHGFSSIFPQRNLPCESLSFLQSQILPNLGDYSSNFSSCQFEQFQAANLQNYNQHLGQLLNINEQNNLLYIGDNLKTLCHKLPPPPPPPQRELDLLAVQTQQLFSLPRLNQQGFRLVSKLKSTTESCGLQQTSIQERSAKINSPIDSCWQDSSTSKIPNDLEPFGFTSHDSCTLQTPNQSQDIPSIPALISTSSSNLNLESIKDITDIAKLKELGSKVFGSELSPSILPGTPFDALHSNKRSQVMHGIESYLQTLNLKIDFKDIQNYSLFFNSKFLEKDIFPNDSNPEIDDLTKQIKQQLNSPDNQPQQSQFQQQQQQIQTSNIQSTFINARRNKKREQRIKESLKSNSQLSTKFHNLTRLLMYKIVKIFRDEDKMTQFYELSPSLAVSLKTVAGKLKQHSRDTCKSAVKTNFYTHSHYNVLFLILNEETIKMLSNNPKDIEAHKYIFGLDLLDADPVKLSFANLIKTVAFKIVKISLQREIVESEDLIGPTKEILNNSQNEPENYIGNLRSAYFERAFQGIIKMNNGCLVNRF